MTLNFEIILKEISRNNLKSATFVTRVIWYRMYNFKNVKNSHGGVLLLVKLQAETCNFTKSNTPEHGQKLCGILKLSKFSVFLSFIFFVLKNEIT